MKRISVIGAGTMGRGIAYTAAVSGFTTILNDISDENLTKAKDYIEKTLETSAKKDLFLKQLVKKRYKISAT